MLFIAFITAAGKQYLHQFRGKFGYGIKAAQIPFYRNGKLAGFLRKHHHHRVGIFAHADGGSVAGAKLHGDVVVFGQRQNAPRRVYTCIADNDCAVVQRGFVEEDVGDDACVGNRVYLCAGSGDVVEDIFLLKHHQRPHLLLLQRAECVCHPVDGIQLRLVRVFLFTENAGASGRLLTR